MLKHAPLSFPIRLFGALVFLACAPAPTQAADTPLDGDPVRGKARYANCTSCHSIDQNDVGPLHRGVVGRKAGTAPGYDYSPALKASGIVWDKASLDRWLANPSAMVPGTKMFFEADPFGLVEAVP